MNETPDSAADALYRNRHSLAHVMAQAVLEMREGSTLGFGPPVADGFYYDFILSEPLTEKDFPKIEQHMRRILKKGQRFYREDVPVEEGYRRLDEMGEPYKREYAQHLVETKALDRLTFYRNGPFLDMCDGPHVDVATAIPGDAFRLRSVAGANWRSDRDAQFEHINTKADDFLQRCQPVVSVDTKKKELVGEFKNGGREWQPKGSPEKSLVHDFPKDSAGKAIPYGIYDMGAQRSMGECRT